MALPIIIAKNQTGSPIFLPYLNATVPASPATLQLTPGAGAFFEATSDSVLNVQVENGNIVLNDGTSDLSAAAALAYMAGTGNMSSTSPATNDLGGTFATPTVVSASGAFAFKATYTPTFASGNNNNIDITDLVTMNAQGGAGGSVLTGFAGGTAGRLLIVQNFGTNPITIANNNASSSAANRISYSGPAIILQQNQSAVLQYESSGFATIWRVVARPDVLGTTSVQGDVLYFDGTAWAILPAGTVGQFFRTSGTGANPTWATPVGVGTGDVVGPGSATDNALVRFDATTGKLIQNSGVTVDDSNNVILPAAYTSQTQMAAPADPASGTRRTFVDSATGELSVRTSAGVTLSLESGARVSHTISANTVLPAGFSSVVSRYLEIAAGITFEIGAGSDLEIT